MAFKSGHVIIAGRPNVGKSTLFNALVGQRLSIISPKPQTTRNNILGIVTDENSQIMFMDTPGLLSASYRLQEFMSQQIGSAFESADVLLGIVDGADFDATFDSDVQKTFLQWDIPRIVAINKTDLITPDQTQRYEQKIRDTLSAHTFLSVSAIAGGGITDLHSALVNALPEGPKYYPDDMLAEQPERFFVSELIREEVFHQLRQELPYATAITIEAFEEDRPKVYIQANIIVERNSQKGIVIGKKGKTLKTIGQHARKKIEIF
ncbi:MAG: GTPase Era, partial [Candidatus Latescibacteria bacterium]|nr:GTPase Era [Candidatus Latescibacterota bacterium]